jgi:hypothetical protein
MVKKLELLKIVVPDEFVDEFVAGGIIAKLSPSCRDFTTTLKHKGLICLSHIWLHLLILRTKVELKMDDLKEFRIKPVSTRCTSRSRMARAKDSKTRITISQSKILPSKGRIKRRMRAASYVVPLIIGQRSA